MILMGVSLLVVALDQFTKFLILRSLSLNESVSLYPNILYLTHTQNPGTAFGLMSNMELFVRIPFFVAITTLAGFIIYFYQRFIPPERHVTRVALGLVWGGALGNFADRMMYGKVIDFIDMRYQGFQWYQFNLADTCITIGLLYLLVEFIWAGRRKTPA
jgi:signal peptidase II